MAIGIRGTSGWIRVVDRWSTEIYVLEGAVRLSVTDPVTAQVKTAELQGGEMAVAVAYPQERAGDKCDILREQFEAGGIDGFVLVELAQDPELCAEIFEETGLDVRSAAEAAQERLERDQQEMWDKLDRIEEELAGQDNNISKEPVWGQAPSSPAASGDDRGDRDGGGGGTDNPPEEPPQKEPETPARPETAFRMPMTAQAVQNYLTAHGPGTYTLLPSLSGNAADNDLTVDIGMTVPRGTTLILSDGIVVGIENGSPLTVDGTMRGDGIFNHGTLRVNSSNTLEMNYIVNSGTLTNTASGRIVVEDMFRTGHGGVLNNAGIIEADIILNLPYADGSYPEGGGFTMDGGVVNGDIIVNYDSTFTMDTGTVNSVVSVAGGAAFTMNGGETISSSDDAAVRAESGPQGVVRLELKGGTITNSGGGYALFVDYDGGGEIELPAPMGTDFWSKQSQPISRNKGETPWIPNGYIINGPDAGDWYHLLRRIDGHMILGAWRAADVDGVTVQVAVGWDIEGDPVELNVGAKDSSAAADAVNEYRPGDVLYYTNAGAIDAAEWTLSKNGVYNVIGDSSVTNMEDPVISRGQRDVLLEDGTFAASAGVKTIYVVFDVQGEVERIEAEIRLQNITLGELRRDNADPSKRAEATVGLSDGAVTAASEVTAVVVKSAPGSVYGTCGDHMIWVYVNGILTISGTGDMTDFQNFSDSPWQRYKKNIQTLVIEDGVESIGDYAFSDCKAMTSAVIPDGVTSIGKDAFSGCTSLESVEIPASVESIEHYAFYGSGLTEAIIPAGIERIEDCVFMECRGLKNVTIPDSVTSIGGYAFYYCSSLESVIIPNSVASIGDYAFYSCRGLTKITIPGSVESMGENAFSRCDNLKNVTISNGVKSIGRRAFETCRSLTEVTIPGTVDSIGEDAFSSCRSLEKVIISNGVKSIGASAFTGCSSLTEITIPRSVERIAVSAFYGCRNLQFISYGGSLDDWKELVGEDGIGDTELPSSAVIQFSDGTTRVLGEL